MGDSGKEKLCKLAGKDFPKKKFTKYAALVQGARYICVKCGRAAQDKENLCKPEKIG